MAGLAEFLATATERRFAWGSWDCLTWLGEWVWDQRDIDPIAPWRGRYHTALGATRIVARAGGMAAVMGLGCSIAGLRRTEAPHAGAVGLVTAATRKGPEPVGALCTGPRWAVLSERGLVVAPFPVLAAWEV